MEEMRVSSEHVWVSLDEDVVVVGISDHAQKQLKDIVFVELPQKRKYKKGENLAVIESVKSVNDIVCPVSGLVIKVNNLLENSPEILNQDPYGKGWIAKMKISNNSDYTSMLTKDEYDKTKT